jgi:hypothetical protein
MVTVALEAAITPVMQGPCHHFPNRPYIIRELLLGDVGANRMDEVK